MSLPRSILSLLSRTPPQTCLFGDSYVTEEAKKHNLLAEGSLFPTLDRFTYFLTDYGAKHIGKDRGRSHTELLDIMAEMQVSFSYPNESIRNFFAANGIDTRHDGIWEMYLMDPQLCCDYVVRCYTNNTEKIASIFAYAKNANNSKHNY